MAARYDSYTVFDLLLKATKKINQLAPDGKTCTTSAVQHGSLNVVKKLWKDSRIPPEIWQGDTSSQTNSAVHLAAEHNRLSVLKFLLEVANEEWKSKHGTLLFPLDKISAGEAEEESSPLHLAAANGHLDICRYLVEKYNLISAIVHSGASHYVHPIFAAMNSGNLELCQYLASSIPDFDIFSVTNLKSMNILSYCVSRCNFVSEKCDLNILQWICRLPGVQKACGPTTLSDAVEHCNLEAVKILTAIYSASPFNGGLSGESPLYFALKNEKFEVAEHLLLTYPEIDVIWKSELNEMSETALTASNFLSDQDVVAEKKLKTFVDNNKENANHDDLVCRVMKKIVDMAGSQWRKLIPSPSGKNKTLNNEEKIDPGRVAVHQGNVQLLKFYIEKGFTNLKTDLFCSGAHDSASNYRSCYQAPCWSSNNAVFQAAIRGHKEMMEYLLSLPEVDVNRTEWENGSEQFFLLSLMYEVLVHQCPENVLVEITKLLISHPTITNEHLTDAVYRAISLCLWDVVTYILQNSANKVNVVDPEEGKEIQDYISMSSVSSTFLRNESTSNGDARCSLLGAACERSGAEQVIPLLVSLGADVNESCFADQQSYPLHVATSCGNLGVIKALLDHGADVSKKYRARQTPLEMVKQKDWLAKAFPGTTTKFKDQKTHFWRQIKTEIMKLLQEAEKKHKGEKCKKNK